MAFKHRKNPEDLEAFIEGAGVQTSSGQPQAEKHPEDSEGTPILLTVTGRLDRLRGCTRPLLFHPLAELDQEIQQICRGSKPLVYNYLARLGLEQLKREGKLRIVNIDRDHIEE